MLGQVYRSRRVILSLCVLLLLSRLASRASADFWPLPKNSDTFSEDGAYVFRIIPTFGSDKSYRPGTCRGMLYAKKGHELLLQWERPLVNDVCPIDVRVANSGKYVITVGEWDRLDKLPIVVYGAKGDLINVYGELWQIIDTSRFASESSDSIGGEEFPPCSERGWDWLSHCLMFFGADDDYFIVRLRNNDIWVFQTGTGRLIDDRWREEVKDAFPDKVKTYDALKENLGRLVVLKALQSAASDLPEVRKDGLFVLNQCRDQDSMRVLEQALKDSSSKIVNTRQGHLLEYPIRKAAKVALEALGEKVPENIVTEEKVETNGEKGRY